MTDASGATRVRRPAIVLVLLVVVLLGLVWWGASGIGRWLVVEDPLERANAIVVLGGHVPFRAMEAAAIYGAGWAPEVWLSQAVEPGRGSGARAARAELRRERTW